MAAIDGITNGVTITAPARIYRICSHFAKVLPLKPATPTATEYTPMIAETNANIVSPKGVPGRRSIPLQYTNANGMINTGSAIIQDKMPVLNQFDFARLALTYTAEHTGGVILDNAE